MLRKVIGVTEVIQLNQRNMTEVEKKNKDRQNTETKGYSLFLTDM